MCAGFAQDSAPLPPKPKRLRVRVEPAKPKPVPKVSTSTSKPRSRKQTRKSPSRMAMVLNDDEAALLREYRDIEAISQARKRR